MEPIVYNNDFLKRHSLYRHCASTLNAVSERDYPKKNYFDTRIECLDMDTYEKKCGGNADCTVDAVIGISKCVNKVTSSHRLLLVELRMLYVNANNLSKTELEQKIKHTKDLLGSELSIDKNNIFVFTDNVAPQARSFINRLMQGSKYFIVWSVSDFRNNIKSIDEMPYIPINPPDKICKELDGFVKTQKWQQLFKQISYWKECALRLRYNNSFEYDSLSKTIYDWWIMFRKNNPCLLKDEDELGAQIIDEEVHKVFGAITIQK